MPYKIKSFRFKLVKRETPPTPEEYKEELEYWGNKAKILSEEAHQKSIVDWDKINRYILK